MFILAWFGLDVAINRLTIWLNAGLYYVAAYVFKIFLLLANGELVKAEDYKLLLQNCYIIIGIVMLFLITFNFLKGIVDPDDQKYGTAAIKKMIINFVTSILILILLPTIFEFAFAFQTSVIVRQNTIGKLFGFGSSSNSYDSIEIGAYQIVNGVWLAFFNVAPDMVSGCDTIDEFSKLYECQRKVKDDKYEYNLYSLSQMVEKTGSFKVYGRMAEALTDDKIEYSFFMCLVGGVLLIYVGISYCLDMGARLVKLVFYQLIAPIPVLMRVLPDGKLSGTFGQWTKITLTCYLEVYIRILVLYFCVYLCTKIGNSEWLSSILAPYGFFTWLLTKAFIFIGLVTFMKQAPQLLSEITGIDSGNMKLGIKDKLAAGGALAVGSMIGSGATAMVRNGVNKWGNKENWKNKNGKINGWSIAKNVIGGAFSTIGGGVSGAVRGGKAGLSAKNFGDMKNAASKGIVGATDARNKRANYKAAHGGWFGARLGHVKDIGGSFAEFAGYKNMDQLNRENFAIDSIESARDTFDNDTDSLILKEIAKGKSDVAGVDLTGVIDAKNALDFARIHGGDVTAAEADYNNALRESRFEIQNIAGRSDRNWKSLSADVQAKLSKVRVDAVTYKGTIRNNSALDSLKGAGINGSDFDDNKDFQFGVRKSSSGPLDDAAVIDNMNKNMKRQKGSNKVRIAQKEQQKYEDKK